MLNCLPVSITSGNNLYWELQIHIELYFLYLKLTLFSSFFPSPCSYTILHFPSTKSSSPVAVLMLVFLPISVLPLSHFSFLLWLCLSGLHRCLEASRAPPEQPCCLALAGILLIGRGVGPFWHYIISSAWPWPLDVLLRHRNPPSLFFLLWFQFQA